MENDNELPTKNKKQLKSMMKSLLMFLPNLVRLCLGLLKDSRVPLAEKALFAAAIVYAVVPLDLIPDVFPFIGQIDDVYLIALTLLRLINRADAEILREHWHGKGDIVQIANAAALVAPRFLPKRVNRVLTSRVEMGQAAEIIEAVQKRNKQIVREIPQQQTKNEI